jgi:hypothetical protein
MKRIAILVSALSLLTASVASAQATRTWVSGIGNDANPCSLTAPCKTFAGAYVKTAVDGEIDALDSGGYGTLTITHALTIDGGNGNIASVLASGTTGFVITAGATDKVTLRHLSINGTGAGITGIKINSAKSVTIDHVDIFSFNGGAGRGVDAQPTAACRLVLRDSKIYNNSGIGLVLQGAVATPLQADVDSTTVSGNGSHGIFAANGAKVVLNRVVASENAISGLIADNSGTIVTVSDSTFANNAGSGVQSGTGAAVTTIVGLTKSVISGNTPGVQISGGTVQTHQDNAILRNNTDVAGGALSPVGQQ